MASPWKRVLFMITSTALLLPIILGGIAGNELQRQRYFRRMREDHLRRLALSHGRQPSLQPYDRPHAPAKIR